MQGEFIYGNDGFFNGNGDDASGKSFTSAFGNEKSETLEEAKPHLDINNSNTQLDKYLFYISSKL